MHSAILKYLNDAGLLYHRQLALAREATGLTQGELDILLFLANNPRYDTASDIVSVRRLAKSNVSVGVKSLEKKGFLRRRADGRDRRVEHLELTHAASLAVELGRQGQEDFGRALTQGFSLEERTELEQLIERMQQNVVQALNES